MSLKADRIHLDSAIDHFMNSTATRGGIVSHNAPTASGAAMDQSESTVDYVASPSGIMPRGVLMSDVVNLDLTRQHKNFHKEEVQVGGKVTVWPKCTVVTDFVYPGHTPLPGQLAYVGHSGFIANVKVEADDTWDHVIGRWVTGKNEDGFAKVTINLP